MLILSRKEGESLYIGDDIRVTITRVSGNKVRIGIESTNDLPILRSELIDNRQEMILPVVTNIDSVQAVGAVY